MKSGDGSFSAGRRDSVKKRTCSCKTAYHSAVAFSLFNTEWCHAYNQENHWKQHEHWQQQDDQDRQRQQQREQLRQQSQKRVNHLRGQHGNDIQSDEQTWKQGNRPRRNLRGGGCCGDKHANHVEDPAQRGQSNQTPTLSDGQQNVTPTSGLFEKAYDRVRGLTTSMTPMQRGGAAVVAGGMALLGNGILPRCKGNCEPKPDIDTRLLSNRSQLTASAKLEEEIRRLEARCSKLTTQTEELEVEKGRLEEQKKKLKEENGHLEAQRAELSREVEDLKETRAALLRDSTQSAEHPGEIINYQTGPSKAEKTLREILPEILSEGKRLRQLRESDPDKWEKGTGKELSAEISTMLALLGQHDTTALDLQGRELPQILFEVRTWIEHAFYRGVEEETFNQIHEKVKAAQKDLEKAAAAGEDHYVTEPLESRLEKLQKILTKKENPQDVPNKREAQ